ncbi:vascular-related unknown protein 1-like [Abrus precatorius]|uniref:Uncharacterized protein n=1 Tax=Abrus precatorius TaxID=3816 RepID=A0A8B8KK56_ABRPR|nr:vascular-related unknown protein 1-like [Abrus precatorius]
MSGECESSEESGWTKYFDDFLNNHNIDDHKCYVSFSGADHNTSSSLVSDATPLVAAKKLNDSTQAKEHCNGSSLKKRKKIKTALVDDDLEDTASSPINSPKVLYENQLYQAKQKEEMELYQENGKTSGERDERKELCFNGSDSDHTELTKKGLCLVPLSMIVRYLG